MATLYISEFANGVSVIGSTIAQILAQPADTDQHVAIAAASAQSAAFDNKTHAVLLAADTACFIKFGDDPLAVTASSFRLPANGNPIAFGVQPGQKVAVIA